MDSHSAAVRVVVERAGPRDLHGDMCRVVDSLAGPDPELEQILVDDSLSVRLT